MKKALYGVALLFCLFPYTQIIPQESYTQPYALIFATLAAIVAAPLVQRVMPRSDLLALAVLAAIGLIAFIITCLPSPSPQEGKYLLIYASPVVFAIASFAIVIEEPKLSDQIICFGAIAWIVVGTIQSVFAPAFLTELVGTYSDAAEVVVESGRGTLGFAPEPTHFGFHMVILSALLALVGGRNLLALACLATAVLVARSSSAVLALGLGALINLVIFGGWARLGLLALVPLYFILGLVVTSGVLPQDVRVLYLLQELYLDPWYFFTSDTSANMRLGGIFVGVQEIANNWLMPAGLSHERWQASMGPALSRNPWLLSISEAGIPSGILIVIYQLGVFGLALMGFVLVRMLRGLQSHLETLLLCSVTFIFASQYMISNPGFGLIYGVIIGRRVLQGRDDGELYRWPWARSADRSPGLAAAQI